MEERLQKIISRAGLASRRKAEEWIREGRVTVNGRVVTEMGAKADPDRDSIKVSGRLVRGAGGAFRYILLNKPRGVLSTLSDPEGRRTVVELLKGVKERVYPVGRLDFDSEGLLLLTNDGDLANRLMHPRHGVEKTYLVKVQGVLAEGQIERLSRGIPLEEGRTAPARIRKIRKTEANSWIEITIHEGRKRQVRRMVEKVGHTVLKLKRIRYAFLTPAGLPTGAFRALTPGEAQKLKRLTGMEEGPGSPRSAEARPGRGE